jgi:hypothetical protein
MTMARTREPMGKLDAAAAPEDELSSWHAVDWRAAEENVRRLRQRIFTASQAGGPGLLSARERELVTLVAQVAGDQGPSRTSRFLIVGPMPDHTLFGR